MIPLHAPHSQRKPQNNNKQRLKAEVNNSYIKICKPEENDPKCQETSIIQRKVHVTHHLEKNALGIVSTSLKAMKNQACNMRRQKKSNMVNMEISNVHKGVSLTKNKTHNVDRRNSGDGWNISPRARPDGHNNK